MSGAGVPTRYVVKGPHGRRYLTQQTKSSGLTSIYRKCRQVDPSPVPLPDCRLHRRCNSALTSPINSVSIFLLPLSCCFCPEGDFWGVAVVGSFSFTASPHARTLTRNWQAHAHQNAGRSVQPDDYLYSGCFALQLLRRASFFLGSACLPRSGLGFASSLNLA